MSFLVLLLFSLVRHGTSDCGSNCHECSSDGSKCYWCDEGYYLIYSACSRCPGEGCASCLSYWPSVCTSCKDGYVFSSSSGSCTAVEAIDNCAQQNRGVLGSLDGCHKCQDGYYLSKDGKSCDRKCSADNCQECRLGLSYECDRCMDGYSIYEDSALECVEERPPCTVTNCKQCKEGMDRICASCAYGYTSTHDGYKCVKNTEIPATCCSGCALCGSNGVCSECESGLIKSTADMDGTEKCMNLTCSASLDDCAKCDFSSQRCSKCRDGYYAVAGKEITNCESCEKWPRCTSCEATGCSSCASGYQLVTVDGLGTGCWMSSMCDLYGLDDCDSCMTYIDSEGTYVWRCYEGDGLSGGAVAGVAVGSVVVVVIIVVVVIVLIVKVFLARKNDNNDSEVEIEGGKEVK